MKQLLQNLETGKTYIEDLPEPSLKENFIKIKNICSVISPGTEKMLVQFGQANLLQKALSQPERVKDVISKVQTDGFISTFEAVQSKLQEPIPLGYSSAGIIIESRSPNFSIGDRVISNGPHSEIVTVNHNLCSLIPDNISFEDAAFTVLGSIALQGIRVLDPKIGENIAVFGLGLLGLMTCQLLKLNGCNVLGLDIEQSKCELAKELEINTFSNSHTSELQEKAAIFTKKQGMDGILITAASKSNELIHQSAAISKQRGKIVLVGSVGLDLKREDFYEKELSFQVSCSYGPGRYDEIYEVQGIDYPIGFVRWTEQRNFEAFIHLLSSGNLNIDKLISHRFKFEDSPQAYLDDVLNRAVGILLNYEDVKPSNNQKISYKPDNSKLNIASNVPNIGFIGGGNYASRVLIPKIKKLNLHLNTLVANGGIKSSISAKKNGFTHLSNQVDDVMKNKDINTIFIATQHDSHAGLVLQAMESKKNIFVEKPLALTLEELSEIEKAHQHYSQKNGAINLMVGFNRRFAPMIKAAKELLNTQDDFKVITMNINAGQVQKNSWVNNRKIGGGRLLGECCHFIDLAKFLVNSSITAINVIGPSNSDLIERNQNAIITLTFADGSYASINYFSNGHNSHPKENIQISVNGKMIEIINFLKFKSLGWNSNLNYSKFIQDKGQSSCLNEFIQSSKDSKTLMNFDDLYEVSKFSIELADLADRG